MPCRAATDRLRLDPPPSCQSRSLHFMLMTSFTMAVFRIALPSWSAEALSKIIAVVLRANMPSRQALEKQGCGQASKRSHFEQIQRASSSNIRLKATKAAKVFLGTWRRVKQEPI